MKGWNECNKPHRLAKIYLGKTGKFSRSNFFAVYNFFKKKDEAVLNLLYEYLSSLQGKQDIPMGELFVRAERWNTESKRKVITSTTVDDYLVLLGGKR